MKKQDISEKNFEVEHVIKVLSEKSGYRVRSKINFDKKLLLDVDLLLEFVKNTQSKQWEKFVNQYPSSTEETFIKHLAKYIDEYGTLDILRNGFKDRGAKFELAFFKPVSGRNPEHERLYRQNIFSVINQLEFSQKNHKSLDVVLFLNGLPIISAELKNHFTGQNYKDAIRQYRFDRDSREPFFSRCFAHFAVDNDTVFFTTQLQGELTRFLPFNKGLSNPEDSRGFKVAYLYYDVWHPDSLLEIVGKFVQIIKKADKKGKEKQAIIFPRYHQLTSVRNLIQASFINKAGKNYLIQHSAGSGKTFTISWLAHQLSQLHDKQDRRIFDSVVVISDRKVIDRQLKEAVNQFEKKRGIVGTAKKSKELQEFLEEGKNIIVTTIQKFPFVVDKIKKLKGRDFAVIIDEAHSSQGGETSKKMKQTLSFASLEEAEKKDKEKIDVEDKILRDIRSRGRVRNVSFYAFTATPKKETLELFGEKQPNGEFIPFSLYSMKQAIDEGFILDVLENYMTYKTYFKLIKTIEQDPEFEKKEAISMLHRYVSLHDHAIKEKVNVVLDHFLKNTRWQINGKAKVMIVTRSRLHAVRFKLEVDRQLKRRGTDFETLVAFTGTIKDGGNEYTEANMNGFGESQTRDKFDTEKYRILIVAEKFQTGFDQPLLHSMYIDKKLVGLRAVQTLSRLNRIHPGKNSTFVLDFVNEAEDIQKAFQPYYQATVLIEGVDPNKLYKIQKSIDKFEIIDYEGVEQFAKFWYSTEDQSKLHKVLAPAVKRFKSLGGKDEGKEKQKEFRDLLRRFSKLYTFVAQVVTFEDPDLEKLHLYCRFLLKKLPLIGKVLPKEILDAVDMSKFQLKRTFDGVIPLRDGDKSLPGIIAEPKGKYKTEKDRLSRIIENINEIFGKIFTGDEKEKIIEISRNIKSDKDYAASVKAGNPRDALRLLFGEIFEKQFVKMYERDFNFFKKVEENPRVKNALKEGLFETIYQTK